MRQGSPEWHAARAGMITASKFHVAMSTPRKARRFVPEKGSEGWVIFDGAHDDFLERGPWKLKKDAEAYAREQEEVHRQHEWSQGAMDYMDEIIAEIDSGIPIATGKSAAMKWGNEHEEAAKHQAIEVLRKKFGREDFYEAHGEHAFLEHPEHEGFGCSPDFIVGSDSLGEIKCPYNAGRHVTACLSPEKWFWKEHKWQILGCCWVTGRTKYYVVSYNPRSRARPLEMASIEADPEEIQQLEDRLLPFREAMLSRLAEFRRQPF